MTRKDPYGNRIDELMEWDADDAVTPFTIRDGFSAASSWELPEAYVAIVRARHLDGTVTERAYRSPSAAKRFMLTCAANLSDFTLMTDEAIRDTVPPNNTDE